jgi:hypothetical protein
MKKKLSAKRIIEIITSVETVSECIRDLYIAVIEDKWEDILQFHGFPGVNEKTAIFILDEMHKKWDPVTCNILWLNKGFSGSHNELKDFEVFIPKDLYELVGPQGKYVPDLNDFTAGFAQVEVEEMGVDPDEFRIDAEIEHDEAQR